MNSNLFRMSMAENRKPLLYWTVSVCALMGMSMAFYPAISDNLSQFEGLFNAPVMKTVLRIFAMGPEEMGTLPGFYATYASVYMILIGAFFASFSALGAISGELQDGTLEFLLTRPITRNEILATKWLAVELRILIFCAALCLTILLSFSFLKTRAPLIYWEDASDLEIFLREAEDSPEGIGEVWLLDKAFLSDWIFAGMQDELVNNKEGLEDSPFSEEALQELINQFTDDPDAFLDDMLGNPEKYMDMLGIPSSERDIYESEIRIGLQEFEALKVRYAEDPVFHYEMLSETPEYFLRQITSIEQRNMLAEVFPGAGTSLNGMLASYKSEAVVRVHVHIFLFMSFMATLGFVISLIARRHRTASGIAMGLILAIYFINTLSKISPKYAWIGWISPFGLVDMNAMAAGGSIITGRAILLLAESMLTMGYAFWVFGKKDIL
jgi:hypothetical protein